MPWLLRISQASAHETVGSTVNGTGRCRSATCAFFQALSRWPCFSSFFGSVTKLFSFIQSSLLDVCQAVEAIARCVQ